MADLMGPDLADAVGVARKTFAGKADGGCLNVVSCVLSGGSCSVRDELSELAAGHLTNKY